MVQRRWRSLRDCYGRELNAQQKPGSARDNRRQYKYFNKLSFLRHSMQKRKTGSSLDETTSDCIYNTTGKGSDSEDSELSATQEEPSEIVEHDSPQPTYSSKPTQIFNVQTLSESSHKRANEQLAAVELKVLQDISKRFAPHTEDSPRNSKEMEQDEDRLFLLSLLKDVKKVDEYNKLQLKSEMILLIQKWQRARPTENQPQSFANNPRLENDGWQGMSTGGEEYPLIHESSGISTVGLPQTPQELSRQLAVQSPSLLQPVVEIKVVQSPELRDTTDVSP